MTRVIADITVSLDGFVTGPDAGPGNGLGTGGRPLHNWAFSDDPADRRLLSEGAARSGAVARERAEAASAAKGTDLHAVLRGGGALVGSAVAAGLVDTLVLHVSPIILGSGTPLFVGSPRRELVQREVVVSSTATHITYDLL